MNTIDDVEKRIDEHHRSNPLFRLMLPEFVFKLFDVLETIILVYGNEAKRIDGVAEESFFKKINTVISGAEQCIKWAFCLCEEKIDFEIDDHITQEEHHNFLELIFEGAKYSELSYEFTKYHKNLLNYEMINQNHIRFYFKRSEYEYEKYNLYLRNISERKSAEQFFHYPDKQIAFQGIRTLIKNRKKIDGGYIIDDESFIIALKPFFQQATIWWEGHNKIPETWEFDHISVLDFKSFVIAVFAFTLFELAASFPNIEDTSIVRLYTPVYITIKERIINDIHRIYPEIPDSKILYILDMLTYNNYKGEPLNYCPFIQFGELYITTPHVFSTISLSEILMHRLSGIDKKYSILANEKENIQAEKLTNYFNKFCNTYCSKKNKLPDPYPDIDLLVYESTNSIALFIELKWFSGITTIGKMCNKINQDISKAVTQLLQISNYFKTLDQQELLNFFKNKFPANININHINKIYKIVVSDGTPDLKNKYFPVLSMETVIRIIEKSVNLGDFIDCIESGRFLYGKYSNYISSFYKLSYAGIGFEIPCFEPKCFVGRNDPCPCGKRKNSGVRIKYKECCGRN